MFSCLVGVVTICWRLKCCILSMKSSYITLNLQLDVKDSVLQSMQGRLKSPNSHIILFSGILDRDDHKSKRELSSFSMKWYEDRVNGPGWTWMRWRSVNGSGWTGIRRRSSQWTGMNLNEMKIESMDRDELELDEDRVSGPGWTWMRWRSVNGSWWTWIRRRSSQWIGMNLNEMKIESMDRDELELDEDRVNGPGWTWMRWRSVNGSWWTWIRWRSSQWIGMKECGLTTL